MNDTYETNGKKKLIITLISVLVIAGIIIIVDQLNRKEESASLTTTDTSIATEAVNQTTANTDNTEIQATSISNSSGSIADGNYTASAEYYVPHGQESIEVSLTLKNGLITAVSIVNSEGDHESAEYQDDFTSAYKSKVVGKSIDGLELNTVAGASDTTDGFNKAIEEIISKAQA